MDLVEIQAEQVVWSEKNFGKQPARLPHLGIIEELGELATALYLFEDKAILDAVGDVAIYSLDFCGKKGWSLNDFWDNRAWFEGTLLPANLNHGISILVTKLAHHQLKGEQGIRGGLEHHDEQMKVTLRAVMWLLDKTCGNVLRKDFLEIVEQVWSKVRLRDWTKNKANAHEVAEQQVINTDTMAKNNDP